MERVGPYQLISKLGQGGMAEVWKGIRRAEVGGAEKTVAVKLIAGHATHDPKFRDLFLREARVSMFLNHSTIAQMFDVGIENGRLYMVMEYVEGINLKELIKARGTQALDFHIIAYIVAEVLRALAYAHELERDGATVTVVHRDISPHNVMLSSSGEVKVTDFGVASFSIEETNSSTVKGKLQYMAPEQLLSESRRPTIDIYSVGAVLHELIELVPFRQTSDYHRVLGMIYQGEKPALQRERIPEQLRMLHTRMLEADPELRMQSAAEALESLYAWPGFRNSAFELGAMVKQVRRGQHLRSEKLGAVLSGSAETDRVVTDTLESAKHARESELPTEVATALLVATTGQTQTFIAPESATQVEDRGAHDEYHAETTVFVPPQPVPKVRRVNRGPMLVAAFSIAVLAVLGGFGYPLILDALSGADEQPVTRTKESASEQSATSAEAKKPQSTQPPPNEPPPAEQPPGPNEQQQDPPTQPESIPPPEPANTEPANTEPSKPVRPKSGRPKSDPAATPKPAPIDDPPKPAPPAPAALTVKRGDYFCTDLQLRDGQHDPIVVSLRSTGSKEITVPSGTYLVKLKIDCGDDWHNAGKITLESGTKYTLVARKPPKVDLTQ